MTLTLPPSHPWAYRPIRFAGQESPVKGLQRIQQARQKHSPSSPNRRSTWLPLASAFLGLMLSSGLAGTLIHKVLSDKITQYYAQKAAAKDTLGEEWVFYLQAFSAALEQRSNQPISEILPVAQSLYKGLHSVRHQLPQSQHTAYNLQKIAVQVASTLPFSSQFYQRGNQPSRMFIAYGSDHVVVLDLDSNHQLTAAQVIPLGETYTAYEAAKSQLMKNWPQSMHDVAVFCHINEEGQVLTVGAFPTGINPNDMEKPLTAIDFLKMIF